MSVSRRALLFGVGGLALSGCAPGAGPSSAGGVPGAGDAVALDAAGLAAALSAGDEARFLSGFAPQEAGQRWGRQLWASWRELGVDAVAWTPGRVTVRWPFGASARVVETAAVTLDPQGRLHGLQPDETPGVPAPLWLFGATRAEKGVGGFVVGVADAGAGSCFEPLQRWARACDEAAALLVAAQLGAAGQAWSGRLALAVAPDPVTFRRASGLAVGQGADTAAATFVSGAGSERGASLIVGNDAVMRDLDDAALRTLLVHEGVHVVLPDPANPPPAWAREGLAEAVAQATDATTRDDNRRAIQQALATGRRPSALPTAAELAGADGVTAYAFAALAVDAVIARWGRPAFLAWHADWRAAGRPSDADLTAAYLAALPR